MAAQRLADGVGLESVEDAFLIGVVSGVRGAVWENVVFVGFLGVGIGSDLQAVREKERVSQVSEGPTRRRPIDE